MYTVVIIEDDPMITRLNRRYVEQDSRFAVVQTFSAAHPALFWLQRNPIDLIILDVYMPQMSGTELLMQLRAKGVDADVIMVTSANDAKTVNDAVRLGAVDYLVKPFAYERFQQALEVFCRRRESVQRDSFSHRLTHKKRTLSSVLCGSLYDTPAKRKRVVQRSVQTGAGLDKPVKAALCVRGVANCYPR